MGDAGNTRGKISPRGWHSASAGAAILAGITFFSAGAQSAKIDSHVTAGSHPHVYLMRGLLNIFSLGMDQLAAQIARHGVEASVYNHTVADTIVARITQQYRTGDHGPYILVGHSLGADAVMTMAQELNARGIPVALVVPFDGTGSYLASRNVSCVLNLTQRAYAYMRPGAGFHGKLSNVDVSGDASIDHFTIDKSPRLQAIALDAIMQAAHSESCRPGATGPIEAKPKQTPAPGIMAPKEASRPKEPPARSASPTLRSGFEG